MPNSHPYASLEGTSDWAAIDRALLELAQNRDLVEATSHEYIVGYICKALAEPSLGAPPQREQPTTAEVRQIALAAIRKAVHQANPANRDLVEELIAERQLEAQGG